MRPIEVLRKINDTADRCPLCGESRLMEATMEWGWMPGEIAHTTTCPMGAVLTPTPPRPAPGESARG